MLQKCNAMSVTCMVLTSSCVKKAKQCNFSTAHAPLHFISETHLSPAMSWMHHIVWVQFLD